MAKHETKIFTLANSKKEDKLGLPEVEFLARARSFKSRYLTLTEADTLFCYCSVYRYSNRYFLSALFEYIEPQPKFPNTCVHFANSNYTLRHNNNIADSFRSLFDVTHASRTSVTLHGAFYIYWWVLIPLQLALENTFELPNYRILRQPIP